MKTKDIAIMTNRKLSKYFYLEKNLSVVQQITMSQINLVVLIHMFLPLEAYITAKRIVLIKG